ncbi:MAG: NADH-quinone oxidoreductase subunit N [Halobacteriota archaeon]
MSLGFASADLAPLLPELTVLSAALAVLAVDVVWPRRSNDVALPLAFAAVVAAGVSSAYLWGTDVTVFDGALAVDGLSLYFNVAVLAATALVLLASHDYLPTLGDEAGGSATEYAALVLFACTGMLLMSSARSLVTAFVALETAALPSYALVAFARGRRTSVEGGVKYFVLGAVSSAVLLYGITLVYAATGSLEFEGVASAVSAGAADTGLLGVGSLFLLSGLAFKVAAVPFHAWAPDAYTGAPTPVSAFLSSASKAAGFVLLFRVVTTAFAGGGEWVYAAMVLSAVTMTYGNFAAALQSSVKRMLAYSSIAHAGYVLMAVAAYSAASPGDSALALGAGMSHLMVYVVMNTGAFLVVALVDDVWEVGYDYVDYAGVGRRAPLVGVAMAVFLFSLAGLPVGGGFVSKLVLFGGAVDGGLWWLALLGGVNSALSLFYYTRVVRHMWLEDGEVESEGVPKALGAAIAVAAVLTVALLFGFAPVVESATSAADALLA